MKKEYPLASIIIDNWNGKHFLKDCLGSLFSQDYPNFEVILIDDNSSDDSTNFVKKEFPKTKLIENKKHVGFASANNQGIKKAKGKYLLFLNNDTKVTKNFLFPLVKDLEDEANLGAVQPKIRKMDEPEKLDEVATYLTPVGFLYHLGFKEKDDGQFKQRLYTFSPKGACFLVKKKVLDKVGYFDDRFYCYFEESDLAWRIWLAGYKIVFEPKSIIYHVIGGSLNQQTVVKRNYFAFRNRLNSLLTNLSSLFLLIILPVHLFLIFVFSLSYLFKNDLASFWVLIDGVIWNLKNLRKTLKKRFWVQKKIRKISDLSLFRYALKVPSLGYYIRFFKLYNRWQDMR